MDQMIGIEAVPDTVFVEHDERKNQLLNKLVEAPVNIDLEAPFLWANCQRDVDDTTDVATEDSAAMITYARQVEDGVILTKMRLWGWVTAEHLRDEQYRFFLTDHGRKVAEEVL